VSSSIRSPGIVLFVSILSFPLSLFAAAPLVMENADNTIISKAPKQSMLSASATVAVDQGMPEAKPVMLSRGLEVLDTAVSVSESGLELEQSSSESTAIIETGGVANQQLQDQQAELTSGVDRVEDGQTLSGSASELNSADASDLRVASASAGLRGELVENVGGLSTRQEGQDTQPHPAAVNQAGKAAELLHIPIAVALGLIALIAVVPISRRGVTHT